MKNLAIIAAFCLLVAWSCHWGFDDPELSQELHLLTESDIASVAFKPEDCSNRFKLSPTPTTRMVSLLNAIEAAQDVGAREPWRKGASFYLVLRDRPKLEIQLAQRRSLGSQQIAIVSEEGLKERHGFYDGGPFQEWAEELLAVNGQICQPTPSA